MLRKGREARELLQKLKETVRNGRKMAQSEQSRLSILSLIALEDISMRKDPVSPEHALAAFLSDAESSYPAGLSGMAREAFTEEEWRNIFSLYSGEEFAVYENAILLERSALLDDATPEGITGIALVLLDPEEGESILDIGSGWGGFMDEVGMHEEISPGYTGIEIDPVRWLYSAWCLENTGNRLINDDAFSYAINNPEEKYDRIFSNYTLGAKVTGKRMVKELGRRIGINVPQNISSDWAFNILICSLLKEDGRAVGIMSHGSASNSSDEDIRREFIENGLIETVIDLPEKVFDGSPVRTSLVVFSHGNTSVYLIDAREAVGSFGRDTVMDVDRVTEWVNAVRDGSERENYFSVDVPLMKENGCRLSAEMYRERSFRVSGLIPMKEIILSARRGTAMKEAEIDMLSSSYTTDIRYLLPSDIEDGKIDLTRLPYLSELPESEEKYCAENGDLIISKTVSPFRCAVADFPEDMKVLVSGNLYIVKLDLEKADPRYIMEWFMTEEGRKNLSAVAVGTQVKMLSRSSLDEIGVPAIPLTEQEERMREHDELGKEAERLMRELERIREKQEGIVTGFCRHPED